VCFLSRDDFVHCRWACGSSMLDAYDVAVVQQYPLVASIDCLIDTMAGHDHAGPLVDELLHCIEERAGRLPIERRRWFVEKQQPRPNRECSSDRDALALAARKVARILIEFGAEPHALQPLSSAIVSVAPVQSYAAQRQFNVLAGSLGLKQSDLLENGSGLPPDMPSLSPAPPRDARTESPYASARRRMQPVNGPQKRRFSRSASSRQ
jgi:hypothetical protein